MEVRRTSVDGLLVFTPTVHPDARGFFTRTFDTGIAAAHGVDPASFVQDSQSRSHRGVIRGMHVRAGLGEAKYVRCSFGSIVDVVVDLRESSATFLHRELIPLDDVAHRAVFIPAGCAHGWQALTEPADVCYRIDRPHDPGEDVSIRFDDPALAIPWPDPAGTVGERDRAAGTLAEALARLAP